LIGANGGAPVLLKNESGGGNHWLGLKLEGVNCNRDAIGARIRWQAGGVVRSRLKSGGGSYLSSHDPREVLGTGKGREDRLGGDYLAETKRQSQADRESADGPLHISQATF